VIEHRKTIFFLDTMGGGGDTRPRGEGGVGGGVGGGGGGRRGWC